VIPKTLLKRAPLSPPHAAVPCPIEARRVRMCTDAKTGLISPNYANNAKKNMKKAKEIVIVL
jgi:hypothetical protein